MKQAKRRERPRCVPPPWIRAAWEGFRRQPRFRRLRLPSWRAVTWRPGTRVLFVGPERAPIGAQELVRFAGFESFASFVVRTCRTAADEAEVRAAYAEAQEPGKTS